MDKNKKLTVGIIAFLVLVIAALVTVIVVQQGKMNGGQQTEVTSGNIAEETDTSENSNDDTTTEKKADNGKSDTKVYEVDQNASASWEQDGKYVTQFDISFHNNSTEPVSDWKLIFTNVDEAEILTGWNGIFEIKDGTLNVTPESYNGTVEAGNVMDCGVQIKFAGQDAADKVSKNGELYIAGEKVDTSKLLAAADSKSDTGAALDDSSGENKGDSDIAKSSTAVKKTAKPESGTPYDNHGALSVKGTDLVDKNGEKYQLKGVSTHGLAWFPDYVNKDAFTTFRDDWGANVVRLAMYTDEGGGYCTDGDKDKLKKLVKSGIDEATGLGMYVIVDWHILHDLTPLKYEDEAKLFFEEISAEYKNSDNIIYEICNEPNGGTQWTDIKKYAEDIIPIIRKNDSNAVVVVGTPNWSQDVDVAANDPVKGYDNVMYTLHFYAATHKDDLRNKLTTAKNAGLPIFITEFSICEASGNGQVDYDSAEAWFKLINDYNLSYCAWNVSNKDEKSSLIKSGVSKTSGWTEDDLSETGVWIREQMK